MAQPTGTIRGKLTDTQLALDGRSRANLRHGLKSGVLPKGCAYIQHAMDHLRRKLEDALLELKGEVSISDACSIQSAIKWERHGALALRWLRTEYTRLKPLERLHFSREIAKASSERDKSIRELRLDRSLIKDAWNVLDSKTIPILENLQETDTTNDS